MDFGLSGSNVDISGGDSAENARLALEILQGATGPGRDVVVANAACGLVVGGKARSIAEGVDLAAESIDSGAALGKLEALRAFTNC
jgi:anthranilate phosphoribosyltransferase